MSSSIFSSNASEHRWVDQLSKHFIIYIGNSPSIFRVPKSVSDTNPAAYAPQQIGMGAYHHLRPDLDEMESRKLEAVKKYLNPEQYKNFKSLIVDKVKKLEASIRSCYNKYLDLDGDTLAWVMAIDGVYMLHLLSTYSGKRNFDVDDRNLAQDMIMMENQLPCIVLKKIRKALQAPDEDDDEENNEEVGDDDGEVEEEEEEEDEEEDDEVQNDDEELFSEIVSFCKAHTPLNLTDDAQFLTNSPHLLSCMYSLIMKNWSIGKFDDKSLDEVAEGIVQVAKVAGDMTGQQPLMLCANLPLQKFAALFRKDKQTTNSSIQEIDIPSASELYEVSKIQFQVWPDSGIGIRYDEENLILYVPVIKLNTDSEVILRNLVAYELASGSNDIVAGYVDFMCGIIDTAKDVDLLKKNGIIETNLPSEEIAKIFNGISKSNRMRTDLESTTQKLNLIYDNTFKIKACRFAKDRLIPSESAVKLFLTILLILLLTLQAFCQIYGCSARWFGKISSV